MKLLPDDGQVGWSPYAWLVYLAFLFIAPVLAGTWTAWAITAGSIAVFLPLYFRNFWTRGAESVVISTSVAALGFLVLPVNWGASAYLIYAAAFFAYAVRPRIAAACLVGLVVATVVETVVFELPFWAWMPAITGVLAVGFGNIHFAENYRREQQLRRARQDVEEMAKVAERERIARDLHDLLGHTLSVIVMKSELASKLADRDPARAAQEIRDVERVSRETLTEVRRAVEGYRLRGLPGEIDNARVALASAGVRLDAELSPMALPPRQETTLALVLREAITNVVRHANATVCRVRLQADDETVRLIIHDDGRGGPMHEGNGVSGMRARVQEAGGSLAIDGGQGMLVHVMLPVRQPTAAVLS